MSSFGATHTYVPHIRKHPRERGVTYLSESLFYQSDKANEIFIKIKIENGPSRSKPYFKKIWSLPLENSKHKLLPPFVRLQPHKTWQNTSKHAHKTYNFVLFRLIKSIIIHMNIVTCVRTVVVSTEIGNVFFVHWSKSVLGKRKSEEGLFNHTYLNDLCSH